MADGYPAPLYKWYKEEYSNNKLTSRIIDPLRDNRVTQTDGTLTIFNPQQTTDRGKYHCTAENELGVIISKTVQMSFGCESIHTLKQGFIEGYSQRLKEGNIYKQKLSRLKLSRLRPRRLRL